jgi:hypothetical protein
LSMSMKSSSPVGKVGPSGVKRSKSTLKQTTSRPTRQTSLSMGTTFTRRSKSRSKKHSMAQRSDLPFTRMSSALHVSGLERLQALRAALATRARARA